MPKKYIIKVKDSENSMSSKSSKCESIRKKCTASGNVTQGRSDPRTQESRAPNRKIIVQCKKKVDQKRVFCCEKVSSRSESAKASHCKERGQGASHLVVKNKPCLPTSNKFMCGDEYSSDAGDTALSCASDSGEEEPCARTDSECMYVIPKSLFTLLTKNLKISNGQNQRGCKQMRSWSR